MAKGTGTSQVVGWGEMGWCGVSHHAALAQLRERLLRVGLEPLHGPHAALERQVVLDRPHPLQFKQSTTVQTQEKVSQSVSQSVSGRWKGERWWRVWQVVLDQSLAP